MKLSGLFLALMLISTLTFGQNQYPLVSLRQINQIPDTASGWPPAPKTGDTVRVRGQVVARPVIGSDQPGVGNRNPVLWFGTKWGTYIQDNPDSIWAGLNIYGGADTTTPGALATLLDLCDTAATYEFTGVVTMFGQTPELVLLTNPAAPVTLISQQTKRPTPIPLKISDGYNADGSFNNKLRKYYGMLVELKADDNNPLIVSDVIGGTGSSAGGFRINDNQGRYWLMYAQSRYFKTGNAPYRERQGYAPPPAGSYLSSVRGILQVYNNQWEVVPVYPQDMGPVLVSPPAVTSVRRSPGIVTKTDPITITCTVKGLAGAYVTNVKLMKRVNFGPLDSLVMTKGTGADSVNYTVTIPALNVDSAFVDYYVKAYSSNGLFATSPLNLNTSRYSFFVLNRPLTIQDVRYSPFGGAFSSYNGYKVKLTGVVTADTSDIPGKTNNARVYIQNGAGKWSGIVLGYTGPAATQVNNLKRGDNVTVAGYVNLTSTGCRIDSLDLVQVNSSNNPLPAAQLLTIDSVGTFIQGTLSAEPWSGTIVKYQNIIIDSANADGNSNFGESFGMNPGGLRHTRLIWSDSRTFLNAGANAVKVKKGDRFTEITGILGFSFSNYKLTPRKDNDIVGYAPVSVRDNSEMPKEFVLNQNYPNPFNPSTIISFALPKSASVSLKIYDILGQEVRTLVNEFKEAGSYQVNFNASSLNSGIYFYSIQAGDFMQVKKMMLVK